MELTVDELQMLRHASAQGGRFRITGLSPAAMQHAADVARTLDGLGLVSVKVHDVHGQPDLVLVELTRMGQERLKDLE
ncbi:MAG: hypothetical protein AB7I09_19880 [Planctomycetota bacterium]